MITPKTLYRPQVGMRFVMRGCEFEVCHAEFGMVRYAASRGGKPCRITGEQFIKLQESDEISGISHVLHSQDVIDGKPGFANLSEEQLSSSIKRIQYAKAAIAELAHPNSKKKLAEWIPNYAERIKDTEPPAPRTVSEWIQKYLLDGEQALINSDKKKGNRSFRFSPEIELLVLDAVDVFLQEEHRDAKDVLAYVVGHLAEQNLLTKDDSKVDIPSERTVRRILERIDPHLLTRIKKGRLAAEKQARAAGKSIISPRPLHLVQIDTHFLKVFVVDPDTGEILGKPYLACALDVRTRCVVGIYISMLPPSTQTTLGVIKEMLTRPQSGLPGGVPITLIPDNGVEFKNSGVERLASRLRIHFEPAMVRDPNGKAHIESFFRTLSQFLIQKIKGTTFSGLEKRGEYPSEKKAYATLEKIEEYVRDWIENEYHMQKHSGTRRIPIKQWEDETSNDKPLSFSKEDVDVFARRPFSATIQKGQVRLKRLKYYSHALRAVENSYSGKVVVLVDEMDLSFVLVEHPYEKGVLVRADSTDPEYTAGLSMWEHEEAMKLLDQQTKEDVERVGKYTPMLARWKLLQKLQNDSQMARSMVAKLSKGKGRISHAEKAELDLEGESAAVLEMEDQTRKIAQIESPMEVDAKNLSPEIPNDLDKVDLQLPEASGDGIDPPVFSME